MAPLTNTLIYQRLEKQLIKAPHVEQHVHEGDSRSAIWPGRSWQHFPTREAAAISACQITGVDTWRSDLQDTSITYAMLNSVP